MKSALQNTNDRKWYNRLIFMIVFLWPVCTLAQNQEEMSVILLNNKVGLTEIHGTLILEKDSSKVAIRTKEGNVWIFSRANVERISPENHNYPLKKNSWYNTTTFGAYFGDDNGYQIQSTIGYRFHYRYYAGIGAALDHYSIRSLPVFIDLRADLLRKKTTPFVYADAGLANPWPTSSQYEFQKEPDKKIPGWYLNVGIGQRFRSRNSDHSWEISIGYSLATMKLRYTEQLVNPVTGSPSNNVQTETFKYTFNRFVIKAGFTL